jgi:hypothetical protein
MTNGTRPGAPRPEQKGLPVLAWIAIGCGAIVVLAGIAFALLGWFAVGKMKDVASEFEGNPTKAAAELVVRMNPDLEMVESDEDAGTITVREKSSGKVVTFNYEDIEEGRISFESEGGRVEITGRPQGGEGAVTIRSDEGETRIGGGGEIPDWVPAHPATTSRRSLMRSTGPTGETGHAAFTVDAGSDEVAAFYKAELEKNGYAVSVTAYSSGEGSLSVVTGRKNGGSISASIADEDGRSEVTVQYTNASGG